MEPKNPNQIAGMIKKLKKIKLSAREFEEFFKLSARVSPASLKLPIFQFLSVEFEAARVLASKWPFIHPCQIEYCGEEFGSN